MDGQPGNRGVGGRRCRRGCRGRMGGTPPDEIDVGAQLRRLRNARSLSLRALADISGLNFNTLSLIENGKSSPSVSTLQQIAAAIQVPIASFFQPEEVKRNVVFQKAGNRPSTVFQNGSLSDLGQGLTLHGGQLMLLSLAARSEGTPDPIIHTGQEFAFCLEGVLEYTVDGQTYRMDPGDSLIFEAFLPHRWGNPGPGVSRSLLVLCPSDENDRPAERHFPNESIVLEAPAQPEQ
ncbi:MAG: cupin domain-containing protein [Anaerolineales bacterium]|nr:cupin domain-containing protein [Anaerolineales bacterium]